MNIKHEVSVEWRGFDYSRNKDKWRVSIGIEDFDYYTGVGLRKDGCGYSYPQTPKTTDIIGSLLLDYDAGAEDFEEFCAEFGYDSDSRKAYATWEACRDNANKVDRLFTPDEIMELREELEAEK